MDAVLKYYKLLFTLPRGKKAYLAALLSIPLIVKDPISFLAVFLFIVLFYEERVLNGRRLSFLLATVSGAVLINKPSLAAVFMAVASTLFKPSPLLALLAPNLLYLKYPHAMLAVIPISLVVFYGKRKGTVDFGIAWVRAWMGDDYYLLERIIYEQGVDRTARFVRVGPLLFTDVHFGLMRYAMGSLFPHLAALKGLVPHRLCGSHENNPASRWETYSLLSVPLEGATKELSLAILKGENINIYEYQFREGCIDIVEHPKGADDLPCIDWRCHIADPHNSEGPRPDPGVLEKELATARLISSKKLGKPKVVEVKVLGEWLCEERGFLIDWGNFKHLVVFGNNMKRESQKVADLVSTVDDHSCAGFGRRTYEPSVVKGIIPITDKHVPSLVGERVASYRAMGGLLFSPESQRDIVKSIKAGVLAVATALLISLI
ncbi:MAG: hypothetical protein GXO07_04840 [Crenarchaeota archaeon]|nr:hypothetical protein [Thermoproteota archaeon]